MVRDSFRRRFLGPLRICAPAWLRYRCPCLSAAWRGLGQERAEVNGELLYDASNDSNPGPADGYVKGIGYDPWYEQDRRFVEDVRQRLCGASESSPEKLLLNDYDDGLKSLAPVLAGWESSRQGGAMLSVAEFLSAEPAELPVPVFANYPYSLS